MFTVAALAAPPGGAYRFMPRSPDALIPAAEAAIRWDADAMPIPFEVLDVDRPGVLGAGAWRSLARQSLSRWQSVGTSSVRLDLVESPSSEEGESGRNGRNEIRFDHSFTGIAGFAHVWSKHGFSRDGDRIVECDVILDPTIREHWVSEGAVEERIGTTLAHEIGHCLGLLHTEPYPFPNQLSAPWQAPGFLPSPLMSYAFRVGPGLTEDDEVAVSLLHPGPGFATARGAIAGRLVLDEEPVIFAYVQAVRPGADARPGPGVFADENGAFLLEGLRPGPILLWIHPILLVNGAGSAYLMAEAEAAGMLAIQDAWRFVVVNAGETQVVPDIQLRRVTAESPR